jgi:hypothetical protein
VKLFLVGPKFDRPQSNFALFADSAKYWRNLNHTVISTAELDIEAGAHPIEGWSVTPPNQSDLFRRDIAELVKCDAVILLDGWQEDETCQLLMDIADHSDMTAFEHLHNNKYRELDDDDLEEYEFYEPNELKLDTRFSEILRKMEELHYKKQADYGVQNDPFANVRASHDFGIPGWVGCMVRANDKMKRLQKFAQGDNLVNESVEDSFLDLAVYSIIGLILFEENNGK